MSALSTYMPACQKSGGRGHKIFLAAWLAYTWNNHTETLLIKSLLCLLALALSWLILTSKFNPFLLIYALPYGSGLPGNISSICLRWHHSISPALLFPRIQLHFPHLPKLPVEAKGVSLFINGNHNTQRRLSHRLPFSV